MGTALESRYLNTREDVARIFEFFRDQQSQITLRFERRTDPCKARVLDIDGDYVLLQNVIPAAGCELLSKGASFSISGRADGLFVYMTDNRALTTSADLANAHHGGFYRLPLPLHAVYQQRRRTTRHRLPARVQTQRSFIKLGTRQPVYARILDISTLGARLLVEPATATTFCINQAIPHTHIHVPRALSITVGSIVRHTHFDEPRAALICGLEFIDCSEDARTALAAFVRQISR